MKGLRDAVGTFTLLTGYPRQGALLAARVLSHLIAKICQL